jgi:hypothetical protein
MEQMVACLVAEMKANQEMMDSSLAKIKTTQ